MVLGSKSATIKDRSGLLWLSPDVESGPPVTLDAVCATDGVIGSQFTTTLRNYFLVLMRLCASVVRPCALGSGVVILFIITRSQLAVIRRLLVQTVPFV